MKIAAITRFKVGELYQAIRKLGWTQSELARRAGSDASRIGEYINLKRKPTEEQANKIQAALAAAGVYIDVTAIWPESFKGFKRGLKIEQMADIAPEQLEDLRYRYEAMLEQGSPERRLLLERAIDTLDHKDKRIMEGVLAGENFTNIAKEYGCTGWNAMLRARKGLDQIERFIETEGHPEEQSVLVDASTKKYAESLPRYKCTCTWTEGYDSERVLNPTCELHNE